MEVSSMVLNGRLVQSLVITACFLIPVTFMSGCAMMVSSATSDLASDLSDAIQNSNDPETVKEGAPAYLLLLDGLVRKYPRNVDLLISASNLNNVYADVFVTDKLRAKALSEKALRLAFQAACIDYRPLCTSRTIPFSQFEELIKKIPEKHLDTLFTLGSVWAGWIQMNRDDWNAIAEISRVEAIMHHILEIDPSFQNGIAHVYLGVLNCLLPEALGGKPQTGKTHFEMAIELSDGKNLMVKVLFAQYYARLVFDQQLHNAILEEVRNAEADVPGYTLSNVIAKKRAEELIDSASDYF